MISSWLLIVWSSINNNRSLLILRAGLKSFEEKHEGIKKSLLSLAALVTGQEQVLISYIVSWSYLLSYIFLANWATGQEQVLIFILSMSYLDLGHLGHWNRAGILIMSPPWTSVSLQNRRDNYHRSPKRPKTVLSGGRLREMTWWSQTNFFRDHLYHCYGFYLNRLDTPPPYNLSSKNLQVVFRFWRQETKS